MPTQKLDLPEQEARLAELYGDAVAVLQGLDELGLHQAGAYVSMALDALRREYAFLPGFD